VFVEKLLPTKLTSTDTTVRNAGRPGSANDTSSAPVEWPTRWTRSPGAPDHLPVGRDPERASPDDLSSAAWLSLCSSTTLRAPRTEESSARRTLAARWALFSDGL